jgi:hypothetical protein
VSLVGRLQHDQFDTSEGTEVERAYRRGWNAGIQHAIGLVREDEALRRLAYAPAVETMPQPLVDLRESMTYDRDDAHELDDVGGDE